VQRDDGHLDQSMNAAANVVANTSVEGPDYASVVASPATDGEETPPVGGDGSAWPPPSPPWP
jgi:hypothetical protein